VLVNKGAFLKYLVFVLFFTLNILQAKDIVFGMYAKSFYSSEKESNLTLKIWVKELSSLTGLNLKSALYRDEEKLYKDYLSGKVQFASFSAGIYLNHKKELLARSQKLYTIRINENNKFMEYYFIKNKKRKLDFIKKEDIKIYFKQNEKMAKMWLDYFMLKEYKQEYKQVFTSEYELKKQSEVVYKVFFGEKNYGVIPRTIYETLSEINPQIKKNIEVFARSKPIFLTSLGLISKEVSKKDTNRIIHFSTDEEHEKSRQEAFSISAATSVVLLEEEEILPYEKMYNEYKILKSKVK